MCLWRVANVAAWRAISACARRYAPYVSRSCFGPGFFSYRIGVEVVWCCCMECLLTHAHMFNSSANNVIWLTSASCVCICARLLPRSVLLVACCRVSPRNCSRLRIKMSEVVYSSASPPKFWRRIWIFVFI